MNGSRSISGSCHVLTLSIRTDAGAERRLERIFETCRRFRNSLAGNAMHRLMRLMQDAEYREALDRYRSIPKGGERADERKAASARLDGIRSVYGLGSFYEFSKCVAPIRNGFFRTAELPSHIAQTIAKDVWSGVERILFGNGRNLSAKPADAFRSIRGKSNETAIRFDPVRMEAVVCGTRLPVFGKDDAYVRRDLARIRASFASERSGGGALPGCIRYSTVRRMLVNDHGTVKWGYRLLVTVDGPAPERERRDGGCRATGGTLAIDPSQSVMACCSSGGDAFFLLLDGRNPVADAKSRETARRLDQSRRATNPERYRRDGTYDRESVNARTGRRSDWNESRRYGDLRRQRRLCIQKESETLKCRRNEICNSLVRSYSAFRTEGMRYVALSARAKRTRFMEGGRIAPKGRFGNTIRRFAPSAFLATLKSKAEAAGRAYAEINPWTLRASQYDPTDGQCHRHGLSERVYRLSDGTAVQRDLMSALVILGSKPGTVKGKDGMEKPADLPDREWLMDALGWFVPAMQAEMERMCSSCRKRTVPSAIGTGAWTALQGAGKPRPSTAEDGGVDAPQGHEEAKIPARPRDGRGDGEAAPTPSMPCGIKPNPHGTRKRTERTPRIHSWE